MQAVENVCAHCGSTATDLEIADLRRCGVCKSAFYCCREHQRLDWPKHRGVCNSVSRSSQGSQDAGYCQNAVFNVVEILPNVKVSNGTCGASSPMNNLMFESRAQALSSMSKRGFTRIIPSEETPLVKLMGFEVDLYGRYPTAADHQMNGTCIYLTCSLENGLSPYVSGAHAEPTGVFFAVPVSSCKTVLTCDRLWGIREVILETLKDVYGGQSSQQEEQDMTMQACLRFRNEDWSPKKGNPNGIQFYGVRPKESVSGSTKFGVVPQGKPTSEVGSHAMLASKLAAFTQMAKDYAEERHADPIRDDDSDDGETQRELATIAEFVKDHMAHIPTEERMRKYLRRHLPEYAASYHHFHTLRLFQAAALWADNEKEHDRLVRLVGYELEFLGGLEAMRSSYYALEHVMVGQDFWGTDIQCQSDFTIISSYNGSVGDLWDGVGGWLS
eukprot:TRINITY_DN2727_c0_g1_i4.p1 TRINITY_DN2727_c0_g1~~TRINITY_DN2727_c0_g1_i4.p1  ORF type:complete len:462 (-),score=38.61 TRINITY_DN2727_c0_g1_i4:372-1700(-)